MLYAQAPCMSLVTYIIGKKKKIQHVGKGLKRRHRRKFKWYVNIAQGCYVAQLQSAALTLKSIHRDVRCTGL